MTKYYSTTPVACSRGKTFDAEIAFTVEDGIDKRNTTQKLVSTGHSTRLAAMSAATVHVAEIEKLIERDCYAYLRKYKDAEA